MLYRGDIVQCKQLGRLDILSDFVLGIGFYVLEAGVYILIILDRDQ